MLIEDTLRIGLQAVNLLGTAAIGVWMYLERRNVTAG